MPLKIYIIANIDNGRFIFVQTTEFFEYRSSKEVVAMISATTSRLDELVFCENADFRHPHHSFRNILVDGYRSFEWRTHGFDPCSLTHVVVLSCNISSLFLGSRHIDLELIQSPFLALEVSKLLSASFSCFPCGDIVETSVDHEQLIFKEWRRLKMDEKPTLNVLTWDTIKENNEDDTGGIYLHRSSKNQASWYNFCQGGYKQLHRSIDESADEVDFL